MWKNLDDLSESDPDTYKSFTENILAEVRTALDRLEWPILNSPALKTKKKNPLDAQGPPSQGGSAKSFVPKASFVVKLKAAKSHGACAPKKIFVNITSHPALERPKDQFGRHAEDGQKRGVDGLPVLADPRDAGSATRLAASGIGRLVGCAPAAGRAPRGDAHRV